MAEGRACGGWKGCVQTRPADSGLNQHRSWVTLPYAEGGLSQCGSGWPLIVLDTASFAFWCQTARTLPCPLRPNESQIASEDVPCPQQQVGSLLFLFPLSASLLGVSSQPSSSCSLAVASPAALQHRQVLLASALSTHDKEARPRVKHPHPGPMATRTYNPA